MLNQPAIFLGGQGGMVGPVRMGFGNVTAANSVLRGDYPEDNKLIVGKTYSGKTTAFKPRSYPGIRRVVENNIVYIANLMALENWYVNVRKPFLESQEFGGLIYAGLLDKLALARKERLKRLKALAEKARASSGTGGETAGRNEFYDKFAGVEALFTSGAQHGSCEKYRDDFLSALAGVLGSGRANYISAVQGLPADISRKGTVWLQAVADAFCADVAAVFTALNIFGK